MCQPSLAMRAAMPLHHVLRRRIDQPLDEIEAHALHAGAVQLLELLVGEALVDEGDALRLAVRRHQRIDQRAVVGVVAGRLHDHVLVEAEEVAALEQRLLRRVARRVLALRRERKLRLRPEHVAVRIDRAGRRPVLRL